MWRVKLGYRPIERASVNLEQGGHVLTMLAFGYELAGMGGLLRDEFRPCARNLCHLRCLFRRRVEAEEGGLALNHYLHLPPQLLEPCGIAGGVPDGVLNVAMPEIILNQPHIRALIGQGEAAGVAQHMGWAEKGRAASSLYLRKARLMVDRCSGLRCSLTKKLLPSGFMRARC
jgi:hypothetical protein